MNFIVRYDNVLPNQVISDLTRCIDDNITYSTRSGNVVQDKQLSLDPFWPEMAAHINQSLLDLTLKDYQLYYQ